MNRMASREVADQHPRPRAEFLGDEVEIAIAIEIEKDSGPRAERSFDLTVAGGVDRAAGGLVHSRAGTSETENVIGVGSLAVEREPDLVGLAARSGLDAEQ